MNDITLEPRAEALIASLRSIGYSLNTAVADIIDNSISAQADKIKVFVQQQENEEPILAIIDNGSGLNKNELIEAMRLGSRSPENKREKTDLGRFGLGLKTASFSQCRKLTVVSAVSGLLNAACWDIDEVKCTNAWSLQILQEDDCRKLPFFEHLSSTGTMVLWQHIDRIGAKKQKAFNDEIKKLRNHLALTFHRYIDGRDAPKIAIYVNNNPLPKIDPFLTDDKYPTQVLDREVVRKEGIMGNALKSYLIFCPAEASILMRKSTKDTKVKADISLIRASTSIAIKDFLPMAHGFALQK